MNKYQVKGRVEEAKGKVKEVIGKILNDDEMEMEGNIEKNVGKFKAGFGDLRVCFKSQKSIINSPQHQIYHGNMNKGDAGISENLVVFT